MQALVGTLILCSSLTVQAQNSHPVAGVIDLLNRLSEDVVAQGKAEEVTYNKYAHWCSESKSSLERAVTTSKEAIDALETEVEAKANQKASLKAQLAKLASELAKYAAAGKAADEARSAEAAAYADADSDYASTITAFEGAIEVLAAAKTPAFAQLRSLLQLPLVLVTVSPQQRRALAAAAQEVQAAPAPATYEDMFSKGELESHSKKYHYKSGNVVELLKELKQTFEEKRVEATKAETASANDYELSKSARDSAMGAATDAQGQKTMLLGEVEGALAQAKQDLIDTKDTLAADSKSLKETTLACTMKREEWEERTSVREDELKAMASAVEILEEVSGVRHEKPVIEALPAAPEEQLTATGAPEEKMEGAPEEMEGMPSLLQVLGRRGLTPQSQAVNLLREEARRSKSSDFSRFVEEVAAHADGPFDQVNNMIQKMIFRLMAEQKDEDDHKNWCDLEMDKTNTSVIHKEEKLVSLKLKIEASRTDAAKLANDIQAANDRVSQLTSFMQELSEVRAEGKKQNMAAIKDAEEAQAAIAKASAVLEAFYKGSGSVPKEPWELLQSRVAPVTLPEEPSTWSADYTGVTDPSKQPGGVLAVLRAVGTDFSKMEAATRAQEAEDQKEFESLTQDAEIDKAGRSKEAEVKSQERERVLSRLDSLNKEQKHVQGELQAAQTYMKDLHPACVAGDSTYEVRKSARAEELKALKEAQVILADAFAEAEGKQTAASFLSPIRHVHQA
mmetsp:Transcript_1969/g.4444  ORF Transcript_1969/g.4444 Transcript_1969/m.4444 type:complete len:736 (+) Transcript_1969:68-2275(+)